MVKRKKTTSHKQINKFQPSKVGKGLAWSVVILNIISTIVNRVERDRQGF